MDTNAEIYGHLAELETNVGNHNTAAAYERAASAFEQAGNGQTEWAELLPPSPRSAALGISIFVVLMGRIGGHGR
jgi:hypothetical protein